MVDGFSRWTWPLPTPCPCSGPASFSTWPWTTTILAGSGRNRGFFPLPAPRTNAAGWICYAVKGRYTTRMEQTLRVGGEVWVNLPYREFFIDPQADAV